MTYNKRKCQVVVSALMDWSRNRVNGGTVPMLAGVIGRLLCWVIPEGLSEEVTFELRPKWCWGVSHVKILGRRGLVEKVLSRRCRCLSEIRMRWDFRGNVSFFTYMFCNLQNMSFPYRKQLFNKLCGLQMQNTWLLCWLLDLGWILFSSNWFTQSGRLLCLITFFSLHCNQHYTTCLN